MTLAKHAMALMNTKLS